MIEVETDNWLERLLPNVISLARAAGHAILEFYNDVNPVTEYKRDDSPLTDADLMSNDVIVKGLANLSPNWPVISEESADIPYSRRNTWRYFWMVDPLDGTKEFLRRSGEFTVNIALMERNRPVLGVVYAPRLDKMYFAAHKLGAYRANMGTVSKIQTQQAISGTVRTLVSRSHQSREDILKYFGGSAHNWEFIAMGSSLKFCMIAEGAADIYPRLGATMEWDIAAAQCLIEEAGGMLSDLDGRPLKYNKLLLVNPGFIVRGGCYPNIQLNFEEGAAVHEYCSEIH